jgi:hypothetical protein
MNRVLEFIAAILIWAVTLAFQAFLVAHGKPPSGWIGLGGFLLGGSCIGIELL